MYTKRHAQKLADKLGTREDMETLFEIAQTSSWTANSSKTETNKSRWKMVGFWEKFLEINEAIFNCGRDMTIINLEWLRVYVLPTLRLWKKIGKENDFDEIYLQVTEGST